MMLSALLRPKRFWAVLLWAILSILSPLPDPRIGLAQGAGFNIYLPVIVKTLSISNLPQIGPITTNLIDYPNNQVPTYEKLELT
ncbi:MAG: hypothetical protein KDF65_02840, partial [Anaerolineae bacterium]|nr:hypothetical protein [Anaerolineae bacterium]